MSNSSEECPASREKMYPWCTSVQSYKVSTALLYSVAHLDNLLRSPISIGSKINNTDPMGAGKEQVHHEGDNKIVKTPLSFFL